MMRASATFGARQLGWRFSPRRAAAASNARRTLRIAAPVARLDVECRPESYASELEEKTSIARSHFDGVEVRLNDAPRANEIMVAAGATGPEKEE